MYLEKRTKNAVALCAANGMGDDDPPAGSIKL